jgi:hypothetical protein
METIAEFCADYVLARAEGKDMCMARRRQGHVHGSLEQIC